MPPSAAATANRQSSSASVSSRVAIRLNSRVTRKFSAPKELCAGLGGLNHDQCLFLGQPASLHDDPLHGVDFFRADLQIGVGYAAQDISKRGDEAGARR